VSDLLLHDIVIALAAFAAGAINSIAGGGTLISFPALVWIGVNPVMANATNSFALWPGSFAAMVVDVHVVEPFAADFDRVPLPQQCLLLSGFAGRRSQHGAILHDDGGGVGRRTRQTADSQNEQDEREKRPREMHNQMQSDAEEGMSV